MNREKQDSGNVGAAEKIPPEINDMMDRINGCLHCALDEEDASPDRRPEIEAAWRKLRCDQLSSDAKSLIEKYRGDPAGSKALDEAGSILAAGMGESLLTAK